MHIVLENEPIKIFRSTNPELLSKTFEELKNKIKNPDEYSRLASEAGMLVILNQYTCQVGFEDREGTQVDYHTWLKDFDRLGFNLNEKYMFDHSRRDQTIDAITTSK